MDNEDLEYAKKLLRIVDVIENYNYYLIRRSIGITFIVIIALTSIIIMLISMIEQALKLTYFVASMLYFSAFTFFFLIIILLSHNIVKIPTIYSTKRVSYRVHGKIWTCVGGFILVSSFVVYNTSVPDFYFPFILQASFGIGFISNYLAARTTPEFPGKIDREYLPIGFALLLTSPLILVYPEQAWIITSIVIMIGTFIFGIYLILTASKVFEKREASNGSGETSEASRAI